MSNRVFDMKYIRAGLGQGFDQPWLVAKFRPKDVCHQRGIHRFSTSLIGTGESWLIANFITNFGHWREFHNGEV